VTRASLRSVEAPVLRWIARGTDRTGESKVASGEKGMVSLVMPRPGSPRIPSLPAAPGRRYVTAMVVAGIGVALSVLTWTRSLEERRFGLGKALGSLADETTGAIESRLEHEVNALRDLATLWQLHGVLDEGAWQLVTRNTIETFAGIRWIAWVSADPAQTRFIARDPTVAVDPEVLRRIRLRLAEPSAEIQERWSDVYDLDVFLPVGSPGKRVSMLAASIRVDSLWLRSLAPSAENLAISLTSDQGQQLVLRHASAARVPRWMQLRRAFTSPTGHRVQVQLVPWPEYAQQVETPWPQYFLMTGLFLSLSIGILLFQSLRTHDYSEGLRRANRNLDAQLAELSRRDRELRDLNEALEQRVRERTAELTEALHEVETFSHSVSHDLRSPLGAILNYAVALEEDCGSHLNGEERRLVERIRGAGQRASHLLNELMEFASSGAGPLRLQVLDMKPIVETAIAEVVAGEPERGNLRFVIDRLPPAFADPFQVHRILVNLLGNALKYSRGRAQCEVQVGGIADTTQSTFWVKDNGPGFEPSWAPEIFKPFRRLGGAQVEGVGLGLAIVAKTVRRQGGRAWADSDGGTGAAFYFTLPTSESHGSNGSAGACRA